MGPRLAPATGPLWGEQASQAKQPQPPVAADLDAVLATQPGPDLAVALAGERRASSTWRISSSSSPSLIEVAGPGRIGCWAWRRAYSVERGAPSTRHTTATGSWSSWRSGPLRRRDLEPPFFGGRPEDLVLHGQLADLALGLPQGPIIRAAIGPLAFEALLAGS
jgi:hypothetical protein